MTETVQRLDERSPEQPCLLTTINRLIANPPATFRYVTSVGVANRNPDRAIASEALIPGRQEPAYGLELWGVRHQTRARVWLIGDPLPDGRQTQYEYLMYGSGEVMRFRRAYPACDQVRSAVEDAIRGIVAEGSEWFQEDLVIAMRSAGDALVGRMYPKLLDKGVLLDASEIVDLTREVGKLTQVGVGVDSC